MSSTKRKFKYKLSGFEQLWEELERLEEREEILVRTLKIMMEDDSPHSRATYYQAALNNLSKIPGKSAGYKMIENMGIDFYEKVKDEFRD
jgi:hypothetical protein